ncbi:hypothetical protein [Niabella beijingensis]|uniref:hypothetical protein n=1 Tax=Niabella beijingensis TaxID=2872700 RepID=UPI001CBB80D8|nr:hypothetical protein [Niabella beijingensis]MBZ4190329.1 hypothetical protein [Niabella beijingensis]
MKKNTVVLLLLFCLGFAGCSGCHFSKGVKKDLTTGLTYEYNGLGVTDVFLTDGNKRLTSNKVPLGSKVVLAADGVDYFTQKEGKVFPGCHMKVTDKAGNAVLDLPDLFEQYKEGVVPSEARTITATFTTGNPMVAGASYHLEVDVFDKLNQENRLKAAVDLLAQ